MAGQGRGAGGGSRGQVGVGPSSWFGAGGVAAAGGVGERGAASLTWVLGQASGDMMTGGVFSLAGGAAAESLQGVRAAPGGAGGWQASGGSWPRCPVIGDGAAFSLVPRSGGGAAGRAVVGGEGVVAEGVQDVNGLADELAGFGQGGALAVAPVLDLGVVGVVGSAGAGVGLAGLVQGPAQHRGSLPGQAGRAGPCRRRTRR